MIDRGDRYAQAATTDVDGLLDERTFCPVRLGLNADGQSDGDPIVFAAIICRIVLTISSGWSKFMKWLLRSAKTWRLLAESFVRSAWRASHMVRNVAGSIVRGASGNQVGLVAVMTVKGRFPSEPAVPVCQAVSSSAAPSYAIVLK